MRRKLLGCLTGMGLLAAGCSMYACAIRNIQVQTIQAVDDCYEQKREAALAEVAWAHEVHAEPDHHSSPAYACGFKDGFADYLYGGGTGEPPPVPPWRYRTIQYESPEGVRAVEDWFAGFRHGTRVARESGYRSLVVVPLSGPVEPPGYRPGEQRGTWDGPVGAEPPAPLEALPETGPLPRPVPPEGPNPVPEK